MPVEPSTCPLPSRSTETSMSVFLGLARHGGLAHGSVLFARLLSGVCGIRHCSPSPRVRGEGRGEGRARSRPLPARGTGELHRPRHPTCAVIAGVQRMSSSDIPPGTALPSSPCARAARWDRRRRPGHDRADHRQIQRQEGTQAGQRRRDRRFRRRHCRCLHLFERLESKLEQYPGQLLRASVELAKDWRTDRYCAGSKP